jgi:hypothetical protein
MIITVPYPVQIFMGSATGEQDNKYGNLRKEKQQVNYT